MLLSAMKVVTPRSLAEALAVLGEHREQARPLAGATDAMVRVKEGQWRVPLWVNIRGLNELRGVSFDGTHVVIGAAAPYGTLLRNALLAQRAPLLLQAVREIGAVQIQAAGTIGGNLGTASPAGDCLPPLYALEAEVGLASAAEGPRWVPVEAFMLGPGRTVRRPDELITAVRFAPQADGERSLWQKLGLRGAQAISLVSLAMRVDQTAGFARFAYGAVGPTVLRARTCEEAFGSAGRAGLAAIARLAAEAVRPITDLRATAEYRREMAVALMQRGLMNLLLPEGGESR